MEPFVENTETADERSLKAMKKTARGIFIFQLCFLLIFIIKCWDTFSTGAFLTIATAIYALIFNGLMLSILLKPVEQLNYRATELKLIITGIFFIIPALGLTYFLFIVPTTP